ncbi:hypothetical protein [Pseudoduganella violacea]|uniref:Uncharacterized protein n=1 Tax=Pseudoduganella violacea TaxID=1715466 RepID=A0A7W5FSD2_9BURK|nr:hypothetical protein [Pseudoduganella violacea]MBB3117605.1 hypothetical protein [Pseudoduganella violacea]
MAGGHKCRFKGEFFDLIIHLDEGRLEFSSNLGTKQFPLHHLQAALRFQALLCSETRILFEFNTPDNVHYSIAGFSQGRTFAFQNELDATEATLRVLQRMGIFDHVRASFPEISRHAEQIMQFEKITDEDNLAMRLEMDIGPHDPRLDPAKEFACVRFEWARFGAWSIGVFITLIGRPFPSDGGGFTLLPAQKIIEKVISRSPSKPMGASNLATTVEEIEAKYDAHYNLVLFFDKDRL